MRGGERKGVGCISVQARKDEEREREFQGRREIMPLLERS